MNVHGRHRGQAVIASRVLLAVSLLLPGVCAGEPQQICRDSPVPMGWIVIDSRWEPARCGDGSPSNPNTFVIDRFEDRPPGESMPVCIGEAVPEGWVVVDRRWVAANGCLPGASPSRPNVMEIRRLGG